MAIALWDLRPKPAMVTTIEKISDDNDIVFMKLSQTPPFLIIICYIIDFSKYLQVLHRLLDYSTLQYSMLPVSGTVVFVS